MEFKFFNKPSSVTLDDYNAVLRQCADKAELTKIKKFSENWNQKKSNLNKLQLSLVYSMILWSHKKHIEAFLMAQAAYQYKHT